MALVDDDDTIALRELFAGMDAAEEAAAASAMNETAAFLRKRQLSFRHIVQETDARGLLLPSKVGAAIQLMDSTTLSEAQSALAGARRLMRGCGLNFAGIIGALDQQPGDADEIERLRLAYQIEVERCREMAAELQLLRASVAGSGQLSPPTASTGLRNFIVMATLLLGIFLTASVASTVADLFRSATTTAIATQQGLAAVRRENAERSSASRWNAICWRDRSIHGPCF
jgi:hypothetical protein